MLLQCAVNASILNLTLNSDTFQKIFKLLVNSFTSLIDCFHIFTNGPVLIEVVFIRHRTIGTIVELGSWVRIQLEIGFSGALVEKQNWQCQNGELLMIEHQKRVVT